MSDTANMAKAIGAAIRTRRKRLGLKQQDVADAVGLQRQTVGRVESGNQDVTLVVLLMVADAVGLDLTTKPRYEDGRE